MPPKKSRKFGRRGRPKQAAPSPPLRPPSSQSSPDRNSDGDDQRRSRSGSNASSVASGAVFVAASDASTSSQAQKDKQKRAKKTPYSLNTEEEMSMLEFLQENPMIWNIKLTDFRMTEKKNRLWADQAARLDKTADCLKGWFKSLRDIYTRLDKKKSGDGVPELTEREQWVKDNFSFLKAATRHRPEPVNSVSIFPLYDDNSISQSLAKIPSTEFHKSAAGHKRAHAHTNTYACTHANKQQQQQQNKQKQQTKHSVNSYQRVSHGF